MPSQALSQRATIVFVLLAWLSPAVSGLTLLLFLMQLSQMADEKQAVNQQLPQHDRAAFAEAKRNEQDKLQGAVALTVLASLAGGVLAVASFFGIRKATWWMILPGAILGLVSAGVVIVIAGFVLMISGIRV
ncbi:hypothetical protein [Zavarzinella formosa]|uniref:hypothetical protein n=1 Tax=Zavarzinella formosa TaxID=360055 RepID=UPI0002EA87E3|nr:hypothetical protein [Zavarzinella formosa]